MTLANLPTQEVAPVQVMGLARERALALKEVIQKKDKPIILHGDQYLEYEDWQTLAEFYGRGVRTHNAQPIVIDGVHGFKASADLIDRKTGSLIGGAEAYCMRDETNWKDKPSFQLASMAQTRAGSKACSNNLRWVVVLVGFKGTPAEEMDIQERVSPPAQKGNGRVRVAGVPPPQPPPAVTDFGTLVNRVGIWGIQASDVNRILKGKGFKSYAEVTDWEAIYQEIKAQHEPPAVS